MHTDSLLLQLCRKTWKLSVSVCLHVGVSSMKPSSLGDMWLQWLPSLLRNRMKLRAMISREPVRRLFWTQLWEGRVCLHCSGAVEWEEGGERERQMKGRREELNSMGKAAEEQGGWSSFGGGRECCRWKGGAAVMRRKHHRDRVAWAAGSLPSSLSVWNLTVSERKSSSEFKGRGRFF